MMLCSVQAQEDLFKQVFKKTTTSLVSLPVINSGNYLGDLKVKIINTDSVSEFEKEGLQKILVPIIDKKVSTKIFEKDSLFLNTNVLDGSGVILEYDVQSLVLKLDIDNKILKVKETNLAFNERPEWAKDAIMPSGFSGFVNFFNYYQKKTGDLENSFYTGDQNYNINYKKWSFYLQSTYQNDQQRKFSRQDMRLSFDDPKRLIRYQLGYLKYNTELYQSFIPAGGLMVSSDFSLNPYRLFNPTANREIYLESPSTVKIYVNSILIRTIKLPAGRHLIDELPLNEGLNNVTLEILDGRGREERIEFERFTSYSLIKKDIHEFSYALGKTSREDNNLIKYNEEDKRFFYLANHIWGATEFSNIGFNINGTRQQNVTGLVGRLQNAIGLTELNLSRSQLFTGTNGESGHGFAGKLSHRFTDYSNQRRLKNVQLSLEYLSPRFTGIGNTTFTQYATVSPELTYGQFISDNINIRLGARYRYLSNPNISSFYNINSGFSALISRNYQVSTQYSYSKFKGGEDEHQVIFTLNYSLPERGQFVTANYNSIPKESSLNWAYNGRSRPGSWNGRANIVNAPKKQRYEFDVERFDQWYTAALGHEINNGSRSNEQNNTNLNFHTALAFVGDHWSVSRPISESFIMIDTKEALKDVPLFINRNDENYTASTSPFGSAIIPHAQAYRFYPVKIDTRNVPIGVDSPKPEYVLMAPFRGGVLLDLTAKLNRAVVGKLYNEKGAMSLVVGHLQSSKEGSVKIPFFTNRKGRFLIESIELGEYNVIVNEQNLGVINVTSEGEGFIFWENK